MSLQPVERTLCALRGGAFLQEDPSDHELHFCITHMLEVRQDFVRVDTTEQERRQVLVSVVIVHYLLIGSTFIAQDFHCKQLIFHLNKHRGSVSFRQDAKSF